MQTLTPDGENLVNNLANRYGLSYEAIMHMLIAVNNGGGTMAQFNSPELGGSGQWMRGGMTMVSNLFDNGLRNTVDSLCTELSDALANLQIFPVIPAGTAGSANWWPADLGTPFSSGGQNNTRYAIFPGRLAVESNGQVTVYDTLDHTIGGVSQQQGGIESMTFSSQYGSFSVSQLPVISGQAAPSPMPAPMPEIVNDYVEPVNMPAPAMATGASDDVIQLIEKLAQLRDSGAISLQDFENKKQELLARL